MSASGVSISTSVTITSQFTRPANTTVYAAGDVVGDGSVITFTNCARANGGSGMIISAMLLDDGNQTTKGVFELWIFDTTVVADADNALFTPTDAEMRTLVAIIQFSSPFVGDAGAGALGNVAYPSGGLNEEFTTGAASRNLFGVLVVRNAYTPLSGEVFDIRLKIAQD